ncbi:hypothetical protein [Microvirga makkahensis]|uniref:Uncharacterized protein n=1 Tax=Microvirga makkahensis TaxID=1128670 RepID=A0A7X3MWK6_9HYPH|nr:hypothetical protein [Microvirga makkahensis]
MVEVIRKMGITEPVFEGRKKQFTGNRAPFAEPDMRSVIPGLGMEASLTASWRSISPVPGDWVMGLGRSLRRSTREMW